MNYINTPYNYTGSKFKLLEQILPEMDYTKKYFVDLFTGSFVVGANVVDKYDKILANDIITELIDIHKELLESDDIVEKTKLICPKKDEKEIFLKLRDSFNKEKTPEKLWALMLSCNSNFMRFNKKGDFNQSYGNRGWNLSIDKKVKEFIKHIRPHKDKILFSSKHFNDIKILKLSMIYADPPYAFCEDINGKITNTQISEAGYNVIYTKEMDIELYHYLLNLNKNGSSFMLSGLLEHNGKKTWLLNQLVRDGFKYKELNFDYNNVSKIGDKKTKEIIIMNY